MSVPDKYGHFGNFGGKFVPDTLFPALEQLEKAYRFYKNEDSFLTAGEINCALNACFFLRRETKPGKHYNQTKKRIHCDKNPPRCFIIQKALQPELHKCAVIMLLPALLPEPAFKDCQGAYHRGPRLQNNYGNGTQMGESETPVAYPGPALIRAKHN